MTFKGAVVSCPVLSNAYCSGLQALGSNSTKVDARHPRRLRGSVNLDAALENERPDDPRWDYAIGWADSGGNEVAIWVEVHPAESGHVDDVISKKKWLQAWLKSNARQLLHMTRPNDGFVWLATKGVSLNKSSPGAKRLAEAGVSFPRKRLILC